MKYFLLFIFLFIPQNTIQRDPLTADAVFNEARADISECLIEKAKVSAALKVEKIYSIKLESEISQLKIKIKELEAKNLGSK